MSAEALISVSFIQSKVTQAIPPSRVETIVDDKSIGLKLTQEIIQVLSERERIVPPSSLLVMASYASNLPVLGRLGLTISTTITFGASGGSFTISATNPNPGDYGTHPLILQNLFNPLGSLILLLGLGGFVVHNAGSNLPLLPPLPPIPINALADMFPREIPIDASKMTLRYLPPAFITRGAVAGTRTGTLPESRADRRRDPRHTRAPDTDGVGHRAAAADFDGDRTDDSKSCGPHLRGAVSSHHDRSPESHLHLERGRCHRAG